MTNCKYPIRSPGRAYRLGCRCNRCRTHIRTRDQSRGYYPRERVANTLRDWLRTGTQTELSQLTGVAERDIYRILNGPSPGELAKGRAQGEYVKLTTLDRLLCGIDKVHLFVLPPEHGGYADIYQPETPRQAAA